MNFLMIEIICWRKAIKKIEKNVFNRVFLLLIDKYLEYETKKAPNYVGAFSNKITNAYASIFA